MRTGINEKCTFAIELIQEVLDNLEEGIPVELIANLDIVIEILEDIYAFIKKEDLMIDSFLSNINIH